MRYMARWSRVDLELDSIPRAAADCVKVQGPFAGLDLDGFNGSSPTVGIHLLTFAPSNELQADCYLWACTAHCWGHTSSLCVCAL